MYILVIQGCPKEGVIRKIYIAVALVSVLFLIQSSASTEKWSEYMKVGTVEGVTLYWKYLDQENGGTDIMYKLVNNSKIQVEASVAYQIYDCTEGGTDENKALYVGEIAVGEEKESHRLQDMCKGKGSVAKVRTTLKFWHGLWGLSSDQP